MDKLLTLPGYDKNGDLNTRMLSRMHPDVFKKTAGVLPPEVQEYLGQLNPDANFLYLLIVALGAADYWGSNVNGDAFFEEALLETQSPIESTRNFAPYVGKQMPRYKTFSFAKIRKHHQNKEHHPAYGHVELPVWDDKMKRVLLIVGVDRQKAPDIVADAEAGNPIVWSMGCFTKDALVQMANGSRKKICSVFSGENVITHKGNIGCIANTQKRWYDGAAYEIEVFGVEDTIIATEEHPFFASQHDRFCRCGCGERLENNIKGCYPFSISKGRRFKSGHANKLRHPSQTIVEEYPDIVDKPTLGFKFMEAKTLSAGDFLATPSFTEETADTMATDGKARLFGYFLAEGSYLKNNYGEHRTAVFSFGCHEDEYVNEVVRLLEDEFPGAEPNVYYNCGQNKTCTEVRVTYGDLAEIFYKYCGEYSDKKTLHESVLSWPKQVLLNLLGAYLNGDASLKKGQIHASSCSLTLLEQLHLIAAKVGIISRISTKWPSQKQKGKKPYSTISIWGESSNRLMEYCDVPLYSRKNSKTKRVGIANGQIYRQIKNIKKIDYKGYVYNFEVEGDNSYVVNDVAVHNCKVPFDTCCICGNKAKTVKDYCDHLKYQMNQTLPSGQKVYAINSMPRFFDISKVLIPADKIAYTLMKVASEVSSESLGVPNYFDAVHDCGEMSKVASAGAIVIPSAFAAEQMKAANKIAEEKQGDISKQITGVTNIDTDSPGIANTDTSIGRVNQMSLSEPDLKKSTIEDLSDFPLHQILSSMAGLGMVAKTAEFRDIISIKEKQGAPRSDMQPIVDSCAVNTGPVELLVPYISARSACSPWIDDRMENLEDHEHETEKLSGTVESMYKQYRDSLMKWDSKYTEDTLVKYANLVIPLGEGDDIFGTMVGITKAASLAGTATKATLAGGALFAPYMASAHMRLKAHGRGERLKGVERLVAEHPGTIGTTSAVGGFVGVKALAQKLGKLLK